MKQAQESFSKVDTKTITNKLHQAVNFMKKKMQDLKKSSENNKIAIKVNNKDAQKQITQIEKEIDSLQKKITGRQLKLDVTNNALDKIRNETNQSVIKEMPEAGNRQIKEATYKKLDNNVNYQSLVKQSDKLNSEIEKYNALLNSAKSKMVELGQQTSKTSTIQNKLSSFFGAFKQKIEQVKPSLNGAKNTFSKMPSIGQNLSKITQSVTGHIKNMGGGLKNGLGHILKYAGALFSMESIYSALSGAAHTWLSSQNAEAKQLSANIEYMKYAIGSALAPIIQFATNCMYQLLKAVQSVVYALFRVNIFAKASASAFKSAQKSSKDTSKSLSSVHSEINNVGDKGNGGSGANSPNIGDLSKLSPTNDLLDAIKNGNWYKVGATIGEKLNEAMNSIPWDKIQNTAKSIGTNIAKFLNGFIATTDWKQVGNTFAQGINTIIYFGYSFVTTFNWQQFGKAIGDSINGFFNNIDWANAGKTLGEGVKGVFSTLSTALKEIDWAGIGQDIVIFVTSIDWTGVVSNLCESFGAALGGISATIASILLEVIIYPLADFFLKKTEECGGNVVLGLLKGIVDGLIGIGEWIYNNMIYPLISAFCDALGIHSPSTVFAEYGQFIVQGLFNGISSLIDSIKQIWENIKQTAISIFNSVKDNISNIFNNIKNIASNIWNNITSNIKNAVSNIKNGIVQKFQDAYNGIRNIFGNIGNFFSGIWGKVKNTFSNLGTSIGNAISGAVKSGINGVISLIERTINSAIRLINGGIRLINLIPGVYVESINTLSLPRLAKGGVLTEATTVIAGEYSGAKTNPEIVTPQNIMRDTFEDVLSNYSRNNNDRPIYLTVKVGNKKLGQILLDDLRDRTRRTGKDIEALVGG
nr:MAG TPA: minor tail protein [Caudoviricetes sp.]